MADRCKFKKNQVVWAKLKGYPWWPSVKKYNIII